MQRIYINKIIFVFTQINKKSSEYIPVYITLIV